MPEPTTEAEVAAWVRDNARVHDRFADAYDASEAHRAEHGAECDVYPTGSGPLLGTLVASAGAKRILEVGCGLGYSTLWLAHGAGPGGTVHTCEKSDIHAGLARQQFAARSMSPRIEVHVGTATEWLGTITEPFDFIFCDGDPDQYLADLDQFMRLLRVGGTLVTSNLFLGVWYPKASWLSAAASYRERISTDPALDTAFMPRGMAISVKCDVG